MVPDKTSPERVGVWLVGARGSVATAAVAGAAAVDAGLRDTTALVCEQPPIANAPLPRLGDLVFGGHDVSETPLRKRAEELASEGVLPPVILDGIADALDAADARIRPGIDVDAGEPPANAVERIGADLSEFVRTTGAHRVVVVDVMTTEAPASPHPSHTSPGALLEAVAEGQRVLPPSSLYALAAFRAGCGFIEFTPSTGPGLPALAALAREARVPYAGADGKTGETLVRAALAPLFVTRGMRVRSWTGTNLLGGGDGAALADPKRASSKLRSKDQILERLLGAEVTSPLHIDYVPDFGNWKTAWDHVSFEGFLGVRMAMQFTWEGCDTALAAPLVLDLARLVAAAHRDGRSGPLPELGFFFKQPLGGDGAEDLATQYVRLCAFAASLGARG